MHEIYLAEKIINEVLKICQENKAEKVLEVNVAIPCDEHFTEKDFEEILKTQASKTLTENAKFKVKKENTPKIYLKEIKIEKEK